MKRSTPPQIPQFYTPADIAARLKVTRRTVYEYIRSGQLPATKVGPKHLRITDADLGAFLVLQARVSVLRKEVEKLRPDPVEFVQVAEQAEVPPLPFPVPAAAPPPVARKPEQRQQPRKKGRR